MTFTLALWHLGYRPGSGTPRTRTATRHGVKTPCTRSPDGLHQPQSTKKET